MNVLTEHSVVHIFKIDDGFRKPLIWVGGCEVIYIF